MVKMGVGGRGARTEHVHDSLEGAEDNDEFLKELTATFRDEDTTGPPINKQLAEMANKLWGKKLHQEKISNLLAKYDPPPEGNICHVKNCGYTTHNERLKAPLLKRRC